MNSPSTILAPGTPVLTHAQLGGTKGMLVSQPHLAARVPSTRGVISGVVPGHGGDVYFVLHANGDVGAYCWVEFELDGPGSGTTAYELLG